MAQRKQFPRRATLEEKFWDRVVKTDGCWDWNGSLNSTGYSVLPYGINKKVFAHRVSVELHGRTIADGLFIDHICRNRKCVNPEHLRIVTHAVNVTENSMSFSAINKAKTHCMNGHEFTEQNTYFYNGGRCRACRICSTRLRRLWKMRDRFNKRSGVQ